MNILVNSDGLVVYSAQKFSFGAWEEADKINGIVVHKWKAEDVKGNVICYVIDENRNAIDGSSNPTYTVFEVDTLPSDFVVGKYLYHAGVFLVNPDWTEPEPTVEERIASLESAITDLAMMMVGVEDND